MMTILSNHDVKIPNRSNGSHDLDYNMGPYRATVFQNEDFSSAILLTPYIPDRLKVLGPQESTPSILVARSD